MENFSFSPNIAFIINTIHKGLLVVTNKVNGEKILLNFCVSDRGNLQKSDKLRPQLHNLTQIIISQSCQAFKSHWIFHSLTSHQTTIYEYEYMNLIVSVLN